MISTTHSTIRVRLQAALFHLTACFCVGTLLLALVFLVWYPAPLEWVTGIVKIFVILVVVDVAIGPLCTFVVFNPRKKSLRFDVTIIVVLQVMALIYGMHAVFVARPAYVVWNVDRFDVVLAKDIDRKSEAATTDRRFRHLPLTGPVTVGAKLPVDPKARDKMLFSAIAGGADLPQLPEYYVPIEQVSDEIRGRAQPFSKLLALNKNISSKTKAQIETFEMQADRFGWVPLRGVQSDGAVIVDRVKGTVVKILLAKPWKG